MGIGSSGVVNCANTYLGTANYTVADGYVADRTPIVGGNGPAQLNLNFARNEVLDPRITFSRTSNATRVNAQGLIEYAPHNLLTYSENFDNAAWAKSNATVTANAIVAPDGTTTADKLVENTAASVPHGLAVDTSSLSSTTQYTFSVYAKAGERTWVRLGLVDNLGTDGGRAWFDLSTGVVGTVEINGAGSNIDATITSIGAGWYRCRLTIQMNNGKTTLQSQVRLATANNVLSYTGDGTSGIYIWGAQLNIGSLQPYYTTSVKNLLGYSQNFENAAWTKSNSSVLTNLLTYSQEFDNAVWSKTNTSITANAVVAPDGTTTADKLVESATNATHYIRQFPAITTPVVFSVYAKAGERTKFQLDCYDATNGTRNAVFNLVSGTVETILGTGVSANIIALSNGWYRCCMILPTSATGGDCKIALYTTSNSYLGDGTSGIYIWGAQLVQGTNPEEYTVTTSATAPIQVMGPLGFLGAEKLVENTVNIIHYTYQGATTSANTSHTLSVYCKAAERTQVDVRVGGLGWAVPASTVINLSNGSVISGSGTVVSVGSGWYRISITGVTDGTIVSRGILIAPASGGTATYTGDGTSGIYIFGAQLSDSASLDPYSYNFGAAPTSSAYYGPRFDYDPVTLAPKGLLIEEARTNLLTYSEQFDNAAWVKTNVTVTANTTTAPDGTITGDTVLAVTTGGDSGVRYTTTQTSSTVYTASIYAKYTNARYLVIRNLAIGATLGDQWTFFDLLNGTVGTKPASVTAVITPVGGGWYRCSVSATTLATIINNFLDYRLSTTDNAYSVLGTSTINIWGAQLEAGSFPTSYIPTTSASVTRAADNASMVGTNFSSWYNQSEGTVAVEYDVILNTGNRIIFDIGAGGALGTSAYNVQTATYIGLLPGNAPVNMTSTVNTTNLTNKIASGLQNNNSIISVNMVLGALDTSCAMPASATVMTIGASYFNSSFSNYLNGHIQSFKYFNKRLLNSYLQSLTQ